MGGLTGLGGIRQQEVRVKKWVAPSAAVVETSALLFASIRLPGGHVVHSLVLKPSRRTANTDLTSRRRDG